MAQILEVSCDYLLQDGVDEKGNPVKPPVTRLLEQAQGRRVKLTLNSPHKTGRSPPLDALSIPKPGGLTSVLPFPNVTFGLHTEQLPVLPYEREAYEVTLKELTSRAGG